MHRILKDHTRQEIVRILGENENATYTDLLGRLQISTGRLNYHLKILAPFLSKQNGNYSLTDTGKNLYHILELSVVIKHKLGNYHCNYPCEFNVRVSRQNHKI